MLFNVCTLCNPGQSASFIRLADSPRHMTVFRQCILQQISCHCILIFFFILMAGKKIINHPECLRAIVVIRVDNCKGSMNHRKTGKNRMPGPPWLHSSFWHLKTVRQIVKILKHIFHLNLLLYPIPDSFPEVCFVFLLDDKHHLLKACLHRIIDRKVHNNMPFRIHRINLLESSVTASHSCRHNYQYWFFHIICPYSSIFFQRISPGSKVTAVICPSPSYTSVTCLCPLLFRTAYSPASG